MKHEIGKILKTHGIKGDLLVESRSDFNRFEVGKKVYLNLEGKIDLTISTIRQSNKGLIIRFKGFNDINLVDKFRGLLLYSDEEPILEDNEFHYGEVIGKEVYNQYGQLIGVVSDIMQVPQGHILRIKTETKDVLVPFNNQFVKEVSSTILIEEIEGLL
ncbi:MAG: ribosome maturation factor RimM [Acholeplasmataceae bacterium]|nr:ribosome maturation factor RimM [Acholeplasmataceae bacterium]MDD4203858.1 ribosome maturation factor RimM [Acholeplasmataceae bacterium]MDD4468373.1 ribosome maturation factor RimM [Acholeplasmataceae bacterium]MDD4823665.1 ribosome maturation factor RimM [Acholeplasmataceae bacterium]